MMEPEIKSLLIIEDDETLRQTLAYNLEKEGFTVATAADGPTGLALAQAEQPDLIILDVMLPELDGLTVCRTLRREVDSLIIKLSARSSEVDKIIGLDAGADDYMTKPFSLGELLARIRAVSRRRPQPAVGQLKSGDLSPDLISRQARKGQQELQLSYKEFDLLAELIRNQGIVLSRDFLLAKIWGYDRAGGSRTVDVHIRWLRQKIEDNPAPPMRIVTVPRVGYRFEG